MNSIYKLTLSICALLSIEVASAQTNSVTNRIASTAFVSNYVRGAFNPSQFNTNVYPYTLSNITGSVTINNVTVSNTLQFLPNTNNPGFVLTADANGFGYWAPAGTSLVTNFTGSFANAGFTNTVFQSSNNVDKDFLIVGQWASASGVNTGTYPIIYTYTNSLGVTYGTNQTYINTSSNIWPLASQSVIIGSSNTLRVIIPANSIGGGSINLHVYKLN